MKTIAIVTETLFPVAARGRVAPRRPRPGQSGLLGQLLAVAFAATPLVVMIDAVARTA